MKKRSCIHLALPVILIVGAVAFPETTIIHNIKVIGNTVTATSTIRGFVREFNEGDTIEVNTLENLAAAVKRRLIMTTWFYTVEVYVVTRELNEHESNVIIECQEGYLLRFGGGNAFGSFGKNNILGRGIFAGVDAGYNKQTITISRPYSPFYYVFSGGNTPFTFTSSHLQEKDVQVVGGMGETGIHLPHDFKAGLRVTADQLFTDDYHRITDFAGGSLVLKHDTRDDYFSPLHGSSIACNVGYLFGPDLSTVSVDARFYYPLSGQAIKWAGQVKVEGIRGTIREDFFYPSLFGIDGIRAPSSSGMYGTIAVQIVNEVRVVIFREMILGFTSFAAEPALFFAMGSAGTTQNHFSNDRNYLYSYGIAMRFFFYEPIFVPLRVEYGWNEPGAHALFFSVSKPF